MPPGSRSRRCPCGSGRRYHRCCQLLHDGRQPDAPEALMRARYAAYALGQVDFLMRTTHPMGPHHQDDPEAWRAELRAFCDQTRFHRLEVLGSGATSPTEAWVHFHATLSRGAFDTSFAERSTFLKDEQGWRYLDGSTPPVR